MSRKVFVGGLPWAAEDSDLATAFGQFGQVESAKVILDKETGKSRGFGFVTFIEADDAKGASETGSIEMDLGGRKRTCRIDLAVDKPRTAPSTERRPSAPRSFEPRSFEPSGPETPTRDAGSDRGRDKGAKGRRRQNFDESDRGRRHKNYDDY